MLPSLLLGGGFAFGYSAIMAQATEGIDDSEQGLASGLVQTSGQVGAALVLAVLTAVIAQAGDSGGDFTAFRPGLNLVTGVAAIGLLLNLVPAAGKSPGQECAYVRGTYHRQGQALARRRAKCAMPSRIQFAHRLLAMEKTTRRQRGDKSLPAARVGGDARLPV